MDANPERAMATQRNQNDNKTAETPIKLEEGNNDNPEVIVPRSEEPANP